jgi:hypothetical protein
MEKHFNNVWNELWNDVVFSIKIYDYSQISYKKLYQHSKMFLGLLDFIDTKHNYYEIQLTGILKMTKESWRTGKTKSVTIQLYNTNASIHDILQFICNDVFVNNDITLTIYCITQIHCDLLNIQADVTHFTLSWIDFFRHKRHFIANHMCKLSVITIHEHQRETADYANGICDIERIFADNYITKNICDFL